MSDLRPPGSAVVVGDAFARVHAADGVLGATPNTGRVVLGLVR